MVASLPEPANLMRWPQGTALTIVSARSIIDSLRL